MEIPSGWHELRLPPESDTRAVREYIQEKYPKTEFKILSRGKDRDFVVSPKKLDEKSISCVARGDEPDDDLVMLAKNNDPPQTGIKHSDTFARRLSRTMTSGGRNLVNRVLSWKEQHL